MKALYWLGLSRVPGWGSRSVLNLLREFDSVEELWHCTEAKLRSLKNVSHSQIESFIQFRHCFDGEKELNYLAENDINLIHMEHEAYPDMLRNIYDPPLVLYYRGDISLLKTDAVAIVGSRRATHYGQKMAFQLAADLADNGLTVVSGMAKGIDTAAHKGALHAGGNTIAVLGSGVNVCYPKSNSELYGQICSAGLVISEFPPYTQPEAKNFPIRNRIISGLSKGVIVVEAAQKSGSLITADFALEQGKEVFAVPGPVTSPNSKGTNGLIKQGAFLVEGAGDVLEQLGFGQRLFGNSETAATVALSAAEEELLRLTSGAPVHIDELVRETGYSVERISSMLMFLEIKGLIKKLPGSFYQAL